jgi:hypothetical protein
MERCFPGRLLLLALTMAGSAGAEEALRFRSPHLALELADKTPAFSSFTVDSLGRGRMGENVILTSKLPQGSLTPQDHGGGRFRYTQALPDGRTVVAWEVAASDRKLVLRSRHVAGATVPPFLLLIDQKKNHATLLGLPAREAGHFSLPSILHLPDLGTFRITASTPRATLLGDARRRQPEHFLSVGFPPASAARRTVEYTLEVTRIHPDLPGLAGNPLYDGYRRGFLNLLQVHPRLRTLANNSSSDVCGFCFWQYSELARRCPRLAPGLTALDLVRLSMDRVFEGGLTYGQAGYGKSLENPEAAAWAPPFDSLDTLPSFLIASGDYILGSRTRPGRGRASIAWSRWGEGCSPRTRTATG